VLHCAEDENANLHHPQHQQNPSTAIDDRLSRESKPTSQYDDVINTVRIKRVMGNLRHTIIPDKKQTTSEGSYIRSLFACLIV